eukprot:TRINITY_DN429_c0_g1_i2.p3 TRINITY_DN429_c0_g1~~TRINITY_DN429_c0_g1_i2.p3  ORF type:complete len:101 (-),score=7.05 TRINITY_DN429_c0_g1_i2:136-438(-)
MPVTGTCCSQDTGYWTYGQCPYNENGTSTGVVAGAVIGTVACLAIVTCIVVLCRRHYHRHHHHAHVNYVAYPGNMSAPTTVSYQQQYDGVNYRPAPYAPH